MSAISKIAFVAEDIQKCAATITAIRSVTGLSISKITESLNSHLPFVEYILYKNDHREVAGRIRGLLKEVPVTGATLRIFLLKVNEDFQKLPSPTKYEISTATMDNMLREADLEFKRQLNSHEEEDE